MNKNDLNTFFTTKVVEYINKGYVIYTKSMNETWSSMDAKIELIKGNELIHIHVSTGRQNWSDLTEITSLETYKFTMPRPDYHFSLSDMSLIDKTTFYKLSRDYYLTAQEYIDLKNTIDEKRMNRFGSHRFFNWTVISFDDRAKAIVLPYIRRQPKCKTVKLSDIETVEKRYDKNAVNYYVRVKGKKNTFWLSSSKIQQH